VLQATDEGGGHPFRPARQLDGFQSRQQLREQSASLLPGQRCTEAVVISSTAVGSSDRSDRSRSSSAGCEMSACRPPAMVELVGSWPAMALAGRHVTYVFEGSAVPQVFLPPPVPPSSQYCYRQLPDCS